MTGDTHERIGILGGTFDPPHIGHLVVAVNVRHELHLDRLLLVVAREPWQKVGTRPISPAEERLAMVRLAAARTPGVEVSTIELERPGPTYTVDTLRELRALHPGAALYLIVGTDVADGLDTWHEHDTVRRLAELVVVQRPPRIAARPPAGWSFEVVDTPLVDLSSTELRDRARQGRPLDFLVPEPVIDHIERTGLYRDEAREGRVTEA